MTTRFDTAPWDFGTWIGTIIGFGVIGGTVFAAIWIVSHHPHLPLLALLGPVIAWVALLTAFFYAPGGYSLAADRITIHRLIGDISLPAAEIKSIHQIDKLGNGIRLFASGGYLGYFGLFLIDGHRVTLYATCTQRLIVIKTSKQTYTISPDRPDKFLETARELILPVG
jgi:hypothetical protein